MLRKKTRVPRARVPAFPLIALLVVIAIATLVPPHLLAQGNGGSPPGYALTPISGADGGFETVQEDGKTAWRSIKEPNGNYSRYMYFRVPDAVLTVPGPVYVEVQYKDAGPGSMGLQYNAHGPSDNYHPASRSYGKLMTGSGLYRPAVFELLEAEFRHAQNLRADLRLTGPSGDTPLHINAATLYTQPTQLFLDRSAQPWLQPYTGPTRSDVDATTLRGKVLCGYQGWFRCPNDPTERGWVHWSRNSFKIAPETLTFEMWPDMTEYAPEEQYPAGGFTYPNGQPATLFSSAHPGVVDRHFAWMSNYGLDGVFVQRFLGGLDGASGSAEAARILGYARDAANRTGRVFAVEYDMSGQPPDRALQLMQQDWHWLVDVMHITDDPRYLHHDGKPALAIFGFFSDRFSGRQANQIINAFQTNDQYSVSLVGSGEWWWRQETDPDWYRAFRRFSAYVPWNVGNWGMVNGMPTAATGYWAADLAEAQRVGMLYLPVIYPGFSWDNLMQQTPGKSTIPRRQGAFYWEQFQTAHNLGIQQAFVAMFDEVDEGTAIFKVTNNPPAQGRFVTLDGSPSDLYLRLTGDGTRLLRQ